MKTHKSFSIEDFKTLAITKEQTISIKGGGEEWRGNVAIIVDWG